MSIVSAAMQQAYASSPSDDIISTVELNHAAFAEPLRLVTGQDKPLTATLELEAPFNPGQAVTFTAVAFAIQPPGHTANGPTPATVKIDNVSGQIAAILRQAISSNAAVRVIYREYVASDLSAPGQVIRDLKLRRVTVTGSTAAGEIGYEEMQSKAFPRQTYDKARFPALYVL